MGNKDIDPKTEEEMIRKLEKLQKEFEKKEKLGEFNEEGTFSYNLNLGKSYF